MSANMRLTTLPLPWRGSRMTIAPAARRPQRGQVARIVVVDIDRRRGQRRAEARNHVADRLLLVVAGDEDRDGEVFQAAVMHRNLALPLAAAAPSCGALLFIEAVKAKV